MSIICFTSTYPPTMCGIADYTSYLVRTMSPARWKVLAFDPTAHGAVLPDASELSDQTWYGIPGRHNFSASVIMEGLKELGVEKKDAVIWFQHESGIWANTQGFLSMLSQLDVLKVVTFHTLHFQSTETPYGLRESQYRLLQSVLPNVNAITVFSRGVFRAVTLAFPQYRDKVYVLKHGTHTYPRVSGLPRWEAKEMLSDFLLYKSDIDRETRSKLQKAEILQDPSIVVIGQTGFLCPSKNSELLFTFRDQLQRIIPERRIVAMRIGSPRGMDQQAYSQKLKILQDGHDKFLLETWLPPTMLPVAQRAFDINFYWPIECTQSGVLSHILGAGGIVAGRDLEGIGETLRDAGAIVDRHLDGLLIKIKDVLRNQSRMESIEQGALRYAVEFSWVRQALRHAELARTIHSGSQPGISADSVLTNSGSTWLKSHSPYKLVEQIV